MASFFQDPFGWADNEIDRWQAIHYSPNAEVVKTAQQTGSGQKMAGADQLNNDIYWSSTKAGNAALDGNAAIDKTIAASRPDVNGPFGSSDWTKDDKGNWTLNQSFNGPMSGLSGTLQEQMVKALSGPMMTGDAARQQAIDAAYGQSTSRLNPQWDQREGKLKSQLMNQGLDPTSKAYSTALAEFGRDRNDAYGSAMNSAIGQGTMAGQSVFNQNMTARNAPMQALQGLQGFLPGAPQGGGGNYMQALQNSQQQQQYGDQQNAAMWQALAGMGMGAIGLSDERAKQNIQRLEVEALPGVRVATWEYRSNPGKRFIGVIAQDLEKVAPQYVLTGLDGMKHVNYSFAPHLGREVSK
jgi:hypothetical protein